MVDCVLYSLPTHLLLEYSGTQRCLSCGVWFSTLKFRESCAMWYLSSGQNGLVLGDNYPAVFGTVKYNYDFYPEDRPGADSCE